MSSAWTAPAHPSAPAQHDDVGLWDLPDAMHTTPRMAAIFSGVARVDRMLDFEVAVALAGADAGLVPDDAARAIAAGRQALTVDAALVADLARRGAVAGTIAVPVVAALRAATAEDARRHVHLGATSQDVIDSGAVLQMREGIDVLLADLADVGDACRRLATDHRDTPMAGRTLLQQAVPITFGLKAAGWLAATTRALERLAEHRNRLALQFGGAGGTLASLGDAGLQVAEALAERLSLPLPPMHWHTDRSRFTEVGTALAVTTGSMAKVARDVVLLSQTEVGEAAESSGPGKGRSSAMPQKRNPVDTMAVLATAPLAAAQAAALLSSMAVEHERAVGGWQAEWTALPALFRLTAAAVAEIRATLQGLQIDPVRMRANLESPHGQPMAESLATALAVSIGKPRAYELVSELSTAAAEQQAPLREVAATDARVRSLLAADEITAALDPANYLGSAGAFVDRTIAAYDLVREPVQPPDPATRGATG